MNLLLFLLIGSQSISAQTSNSPFIDKIRTQLDSESTGPEPSFIEQQREKMNQKARVPGDENYSSRVKGTLAVDPENDDYNYSVKEKLKIEQADKEKDDDRSDSAIENYRNGKSELRLKRSVDIHSALAFKVGASVNRNLTGQSAPFSQIYGPQFPPDFTLHFEWRPYHSEWFGSLGLVSEIGVTSFRGTGTFQFQLKNPVSGQNFPTISQVSTQFLMYPLTVGLIYRFNLLRVIRPYVQAGASVVGMMESRSDTQNVTKTYSTALNGIGGVCILLDGISKEMTWDIYAAHGVKHYYLDIEYQLQQALSGDVSLNASGVYVGFLMEM